MTVQHLINDTPWAGIVTYLSDMNEAEKKDIFSDLKVAENTLSHQAAELNAAYDANDENAVRNLEQEYGAPLQIICVRLGAVQRSINFLTSK